MFGYAVYDFEAKVGFFSNVFGCLPITLSADDALFCTPDRGFFLGVRTAARDRATPTNALKLLFMAANHDAAEAFIRQGGLIDDIDIRADSPSQRVWHVATPAVLPIGIWKFPASVR